MLNENIKAIRKSKGLSQQELAVKLNVVRQTVSKWEQGLSVPDSDMLISISEVFETPVSTLLGENVIESKADDLKAISEKLEVINLQLAQRKTTRKQILHYGNVIRMVTEDLDQFTKAGGSYGDYMLVLSKGTDKWNYAKEWNKKYDGKFSFIASKSNGENIEGVLKPAIGTILAFLLLVTLLTTINLTSLLIRREQRLIGCLKALGMTSRQILKIYAWRNCLSALVGNGLGLMLGIFVLPGLLTPYARRLGITEFPFVNSLTGTAVSFVLLPLCMFFGTFVMIKAISAVSVRQLVSE